MLATAPRIAQPDPVFRATVPRPGLLERALIVGLVFINMFGTPTSWFLQNTGAASGPTNNFLLSYGSLAAILVLSVGLIGQGEAVFRILSAEPLMVLYFFVLGLSPIWSIRFNESVSGVINLFAMIGLAIVLLVRFRPPEIFQMITVAFAVGIVLDLVWVFAMGPLGRSGSGAWDGLATQKNALGNHGLLGVMVFIVAARTFRHRRVPFYTLTVLSLVLLVGSQSKTSLGAGIVTAASFVVFLIFRARRTLAGAVTIALVAGVTLTVLFVTANLEAVAGQFGKDATFTGRTDLWSEVLSAIGHHPWLGFGYDGFFGGPLSESHPINAYPQFDWGPNHAHNALMQSALHVGIPATVVYVVYNFRALARATDHVRWVRGPIGLFPLVYLTMMAMTSITESGIFTQRFGVTLYIMAVVMAKVGADEAKASGVQRLDDERMLGPRHLEDAGWDDGGIGGRAIEPSPR